MQAATSPAAIFSEQFNEELEDFNKALSDVQVEISAKPKSDTQVAICWDGGESYPETLLAWCKGSFGEDSVFTSPEDAATIVITLTKWPMQQLKNDLLQTFATKFPGELAIELGKQSYLDEDDQLTIKKLRKVASDREKSNKLKDSKNTSETSFLGASNSYSASSLVTAINADEESGLLEGGLLPMYSGSSSAFFNLVPDDGAPRHQDMSNDAKNEQKVTPKKKCSCCCSLLCCC